MAKREADLIGRGPKRKIICVEKMKKVPLKSEAAALQDVAATESKGQSGAALGPVVITLLCRPQRQHQAPEPGVTFS